jgi:uncharacterized protein YggE
MQKGIFMTDRQESNLSVTGTGRVQVAPDEAIVHLGIFTEGNTADEAVARNASETQAVIDAVSSQPNHGVTTSGLSVYPIISYEDSSVGKVVGFRATNGVEVTTKVGYVGRIYDVGIGAGANQSSGITFRVQNETPYREEALRLAVEEAFREAHLVARAARVELRGAESIQIESGDGPVFYRAEARDAKSEPTPVIPERQTITARVQVEFRTRPDLDLRPGKHERDGKETSAKSGTA